MYGEWTLHPQVVSQVWLRYGQAAVDLFASHKNAQCPLFFSLVGEDALLGVDALAHPWPNVLLYAFPPLSLIGSKFQRVREFKHALIMIAPFWPGKLWVAEIIPLLYDQPSPVAQRPSFSGQDVGKRTLGYLRKPGSLITEVRYLTTLPSLQLHIEEIH